jgi:hypothetical protein
MYMYMCVYIYIYIHTHTPKKLFGNSRFEIPDKDRLYRLRLFVDFLSLFKQILGGKLELRFGKFLPRFAFNYSIIPADVTQCKIETALLNKPY